MSKTLLEREIKAKKPKRKGKYIDPVEIWIKQGNKTTNRIEYDNLIYTDMLNNEGEREG